MLNKLLKAIWSLAFKNWKTTAIGISAVLVWVLNEVLQFQLTTDQILGIQTVLISVGLIFSKDGNKTGV